MMSRMELELMPNGRITPPPSKSISHRALICAALAKGKSRIQNISVDGEDVAATLTSIARMGLTYQIEGNDIFLTGGLQQLADKLVLDCNESGSTLRFLIPIAMLFPVTTTLTGRGRLMERPLTPYLDVLREHGGSAELEKDTLKVKGPIRPGSYELPGDISSQYVTGLLMALPLLDGDSEIRLTSPLESKGYVNLTISTMKSFGVMVEEIEDVGYRIKGNQNYHPCDFTVEADFSAAAFFLAAGALGCDVECLGLNPNSLQGDRAIVDFLGRVGAEVTIGPGGGVKAVKNRLEAITADVTDTPDIAPPLAALLCFCKGESKIVGARRLRMKESDRLHSLTTQLNALGAKIEEEEDSLTITGVEVLQGGTVDPQGDHRIAMAAAVASIRSQGQVTVLNPDCVSKSYPDFWVDFSKIERRIPDEQRLGK